MECVYNPIVIARLKDFFETSQDADETLKTATWQQLENLQDSY